MGHLEHKEVLWICTGCLGPVGIVKAWDPIEGRWKFFIGPCEGRDLDEDVERILALGQKYYSLDFIAAFGDMTPPEKTTPAAPMGAISPSTGEAYEGGKEE